MCRDTTPPDIADPEVYFRIRHINLRDQDRPAYHDQTVEIALGPTRAKRSAFECTRIGSLTRRVDATKVVNAVPPARGNPKPPKRPQTPRVAELLRQAIEWQGLLESGEVTTQAAIARREGITRARVTQVMGMLRLAPEIQKHVLSLPDMVRRPAITERALRPIAQIEDQKQQVATFSTLLD